MNAAILLSSALLAIASPSPQNASPQGSVAGEAAYQAAVTLARDPAANAERVLESIAEALRDGQNAARVLTEPAFDRFRTQEKFRTLIRDHSKQSEICMVTDAEKGERIKISGLVRDASERPVADALVYAYHADSEGHYARGDGSEDNPRLFGYMRTDSNGRFRFITVRPGAYRGSEQHIHMLVTTPKVTNFVWRIGFHDDPHWAGKPIPRWVVTLAKDAEGTQSAAIEFTVKPRPR